MHNTVTVSVVLRSVSMQQDIFPLAIIIYSLGGLVIC